MVEAHNLMEEKEVQSELPPFFAADDALELKFHEYGREHARAVAEGATHILQGKEAASSKLQREDRRLIRERQLEERAVLALQYYGVPEAEMIGAEVHLQNPFFKSVIQQRDLQHFFQSQTMSLKVP